MTADTGSDATPLRATGTMRQASVNDEEIKLVKREEPDSYGSSGSAAKAAGAGRPQGGGEGGTTDEQGEKLMHQLQRAASIPLAKAQSRSSTGDASDRDIADGQCHAVMREEDDHRLERSCTKPPIEGGFYCREREAVFVFFAVGASDKADVRCNLWYLRRSPRRQV